MLPYKHTCVPLMTHKQGMWDPTPNSERLARDPSGIPSEVFDSHRMDSSSVTAQRVRLKVEGLFWPLRSMKTVGL